MGSSLLPFQPMEPIPAPALPHGSQYVYEAKWDGIRLLAEVSKTGVRLWTRKGVEVTHALPEVEQALFPMASIGCLWLDGEVVVLDESERPSFEEVVRRIRVQDKKKAATLATFRPACYAVFDCLRRGKRTYFEQPWEKRNALLREVIPHRLGPVLRVSSCDDAAALWQQVVSEGWEGVVAKRRDAPYVAGKAHRLWWKVKAVKEGLFAVIGIVEAGGRVRSLLLASPNASGGWVFAGRVGSGLSEKERYQLATCTAHLIVQEPPVQESIRLASGESLRWFRPLLTVKVAYRERTGEGLLRHPRLTGFTTLPAEELRRNKTR